MKEELNGPEKKCDIRVDLKVINIAMEDESKTLRHLINDLLKLYFQIPVNYRKTAISMLVRDYDSISDDLKLIVYGFRKETDREFQQRTAPRKRFLNCPECRGWSVDEDLHWSDPKAQICSLCHVLWSKEQWLYAVKNAKCKIVVDT